MWLTCSGAGAVRPDDNPEALKIRLDAYRTQPAVGRFLREIRQATGWTAWRLSPVAADIDRTAGGVNIGIRVEITAQVVDGRRMNPLIRNIVGAITAVAEPLGRGRAASFALTL